MPAIIFFYERRPSMTGSTRPITTGSTRCLSGGCFSREFKKPLPGQGQRLEFTFTENYLTCDLSGRINEKPGGGLSRHSFSDGGDVQPNLPKPKEKA